MNRAPWYQNAVFYEVSVRSFKDSDGDGRGDLRGLAERSDYLQRLGVDCVWIMPVYPSPLKDDGYDVADHCAVDRAYGSLDDLRALVESLHAHGLRLLMDLVLNHTSDQHPWFLSARSQRDSPYRDYYVWSDTDEKYKDARVIFVDSEASNWTWDEKAGQYYWHRFYSSQPDLNFDNPHVQEEMLQVARFWLDLGVDGLRVDAVPYLFEREGTRCENLPETHAFLKRLRALVDEHYPGRLLLCEANQWPKEVRAYFGDGDEFHMAFHFPLMPRIFMALRRGDVGPIRRVMEQTPPIPPDCQWCTFLRNHDELTLEMVTEEERQWMWNEYAPDPRMRFNLGIRRRLAPLLENDRRRIELAHSLLFTLPGAPVLYYGDEIGMGDNLELPDRNGLRTAMQWDASSHAGFSTVSPSIALVQGELAFPHVNVAAQLRDPLSLLHTIQTMIALRKEHAAFSGPGVEWIEVGNPSIAAYLRRNGGEVVLILANLSHVAQSVVIPARFRTDCLDLASSSIVSLGVQRELEPYGYLWLQVPGEETGTA
jgi:maltose alpha-D-glucosyltransferase/alpha-amylase